MEDDNDDELLTLSIPDTNPTKKPRQKRQLTSIRDQQQQQPLQFITDNTNKNHDTTSAKGTTRASIIVCAVDGTVWTIDAVSGNVRGLFTSGDALIDSSSSRNDLMSDKIVPGLDGYLYKVSPVTNTITPYINVTDVIDNPVKTCHRTENNQEICGIVYVEKKQKIFALNVQTGSISWIHSDGVQLGKPTETTSTHGNTNNKHNVLLQREDYSVRHVDESTGETNWDVRLANFQAWEFPSSDDNIADDGSTLMPTLHSIKGMYLSVLLPRKSTIPELGKGANTILPLFPYIAYSEDGKNIIAIDPYNRNILWRKPMPSIIASSFGVTSDNSWIQLKVVKESDDYVEKLHMIDGVSSRRVCESEQQQQLSSFPSLEKKIQALVYNNNNNNNDDKGQTDSSDSSLVVPYNNNENHQLKQLVFGGHHDEPTLFVWDQITTSIVYGTKHRTISNLLTLPASFTTISGNTIKEQQRGNINNNNIAIHRNTYLPQMLYATPTTGINSAAAASYEPPLWSTPSFGKFHKLENGLFLTWQGVTIVATLLITVIALVRFTYLKQKKEWMSAMATNSPGLTHNNNTVAPPPPISLDSAGGATSATTNQGSLILGPLEQQQHNNKKRRNSLPLFRLSPASGDGKRADLENMSFSTSFPSRSTSNAVYATSDSGEPYVVVPSLSKSKTMTRQSTSATTASDVATKSYLLQQNVPSSVDGIPLVRYSRFTSEFNDLSSLGRGGFGTVFKCQNVLDGREYAVKKIRIKSFVDELGVSTKHLSNALRRVLREVKILALLDHPNIVRYYTAWLEIEDGFSSRDEDRGGESVTTLNDNSYLDD